MKRLNWQVLLGLFLIALSASLYFIHYAIFRDAHHIFIYMVGDIAFVPIEVLLVTVIIEKLLSQREKHTMLEKLNMIIGAFFSEAGTGLLIYLSDIDPDLDRIRQELVVTDEWSDKEFQKFSTRLKSYPYVIDIKKADLQYLRGFLVERRNFLLRLLENPNLLEHESFTELLRAVFHLTEELSSRKDLKQLPHTDLEHLAGDIERVYKRLVNEWFDYMQYLKNNYPYLFSLAMRTNPFDLNASPEVK